LRRLPLRIFGVFSGLTRRIKRRAKGKNRR
jgi:hypothetical protein